MGCCQSQPLMKTTSGMKADKAKAFKKLSSGKYTGSKVFMQSDKFYDETLEFEGINKSVQLPDPPRPYFSFKAFILQNKNPQIFEWAFLEEIGKGSISQIYLVKNTDTGIYCIGKIYNNAVLHRETLGNEDPPIECLQRDVSLMSAMSHPNIIGFHEMIEDNLTNSTILILPYAQLGNLMDLSTNGLISMDSLLVCIYQVLDALKYMHFRNIAHMDVKPSNILSFQENYYCISSFSESIKLKEDNELHTEIHGTGPFLSPEECSGQPFDPLGTDLWALGVTIYWCLYQKYPYSIDENALMFNNTNYLNKIFQENELTFPEGSEVPGPVVDIMKDLLQKDPAKRPAIEDIQNCSIFERARTIQVNEMAFCTTTDGEMLSTIMDSPAMSSRVNNTQTIET